MIRLVFWGLIFYVIYLVMKNAKGKTPATPPRQTPMGETAHRDPICGVFVSEDDAVIGRYQGERIYFCSMDCLEKYQQQLSEH